MTSLEATITDVANRCLRRPAPLELSGLDSLAAIELAAALEEALHCELPVDLLIDCPDARTLAARLARDVRSRPHDPFDQMLADAVLPEDIRPRLADLQPRVTATRTLRDARTILLTGATGFLGSALLDELLNATRATIVCLVRATSHSHREHDRTRVVHGDLSQPRLGLSPTQYDELTRDVDAVYHAAAAVNWIFPYTGLRAANVLGTRELLRLACRAGAAFHFVSSLSTCYSTHGPRIADEDFDPLPAIRGIHLGYAQTKVVGEALVREAGRRGLPVSIYRAPLIAGHSVSGAFNRGDLLSTLIRGCVHMRLAPDLDWKLDCEPVDVVAKAIVTLSRAGSSQAVFHLPHARPRHWRECLLWMRMYGYDVRLVSYHAWLRSLECETAPDAAGSEAHPLRPLRSFFLDRLAGAHGLTLPELYEERRRTQATRSAMVTTAVAEPALDAALLDTYFAAFRAAGHLPEPTLPRRSSRGTNTGTASAGSDHSIISELAAWRSNQPVGVFRDESRNAVIKIAPRDTDVMEVGAALAELVDPAVGRAFRRHLDRLGFARSHAREIAIFRQTDPRFVAHLPRVIETVLDESHGTWFAVLEDLRHDAVLIDSADRPQAWGKAEIGATIDGLAQIHAVWFDREDELRQQPWIGHVRDAHSVAEMSDFWTALADHAARHCSAWSDTDVAHVHKQLIDRIAKWWPTLEAGPRTLIHHDFNPRNICLRRDTLRLCAYDWELATIGAPQRDLAELLCFVLTDETAPDAAQWLERHRAALEQAAGRDIDRATWKRGFAAALGDLLIDRLALYALVHRVRRQSFLPRVVRTWRRLHEQFPLDEVS